MKGKVMAELVMKLIWRVIELFFGIRTKGKEAKELREEGPTNITAPNKEEIVKQLSPIEQVAIDLSVDKKLIQAFIEVESGSYHKFDGRLVINYEEHYFKRFSGIVVPDRNMIRGDGLNQEDEWNNFTQALKINEEAAFKSISMGKTQIMGANHKVLGYKTAKEMFHAFDESEDNAIYGFGSFIKADKRLWSACKNKDYHHMAYYYNGPKYKKYIDSKGRTYADKIRETYEKLCV
jgi:hypothetical protein